MDKLSPLERGVLNTIGSLTSRKQLYISLGKLDKKEPTHILFEEIYNNTRSFYSEGEQKKALNLLCKRKFVEHGKDEQGRIYFKLMKR